ncbi:bifunctional precorrin-2 dehydrogenase/sirohydrochlorin ferrochelatase [candidate division KSB1 bacterium]|nr:bifunctional precorrin-2 dehydrogenase/sirohydrochlorin ferrochelatase [candidate division KSB1 bacterium]
MNTLYPIYLKLLKKHCLVIGGGTIAFRKVEALLASEADVTVISPDLCPSLRELVDQGICKYISRKYRRGDLNGSFLVIAATNDPDANRQIWEEANDLNLLVNIVDVPDVCNFYVPSVVRNGDLAIAISTNGKAPYLAKRIRQRLEQDQFSHKISEKIFSIDKKRNELKSSYPNDIQKREAEIKKFINNLMEEWD